ncbi:MAG: ferritin family protein [Candidatus Altiarchaeota archaeon]|nr:ferritin family protein [Candidatus Altiarchaeota archaeon]
MDSEVVKAIKLAVRTKKQELEYYRKAVGKTKNLSGRKVFSYLAEEEEGQLNALKEHLAKAAGESWLPDEKSFSKSACRLRRSRPKSVVPKEVLPDASDLDALRQAMEIEKKTIDTYTDAACAAGDKKAMKVFNYLIESEKEHMKELEIQYAFLKSEGFWYDNELTPS